MNEAVFPPLTVISAPTESLLAVLKNAIASHPFNLFSLIIFVLAIIHTLLAHQITHLAHVLEKRKNEKNPDNKEENQYSFVIEILRFLGEVEIIFALWVFPLLIAIAYFWNWHVALEYLHRPHYNEAIFVVVIMALASTKPILNFATFCLKGLAKLLGGTVPAWWFVILTFCPILGSFITEPGAMTLGALLLSRQFYSHKPSKKLAYATLGLLFVNVSIGGVLTNFAAPPVLMVARKWGWSNSYMFFNFGIKSIIAIVISNFVYFGFFLKEMKTLGINTRSNNQKSVDPIEAPIPLWIVCVHVLFLIAVVTLEHYTILLIGLLFLFVAFHEATQPFQHDLKLRGPILVGAFLSGLVIHGSLQGWWIEPIIKSLSAGPLLVASTILTSFNDNALMTYLSSLIKDLSPILKYAVVSGAVAGGGLTVIANAPNPAGQFILKEFFEDGVAPLNLFLGALLPTSIILAISYLSLLLF